MNVSKIQRDDLPALYHTATEASGEAQGKLLFFSKLNIILLSIGAMSSGINIGNINDPFWQSTLSFISAVTLLISIFITFYLDRSEFEKKWYEGRAIAESVKTIAWRFMMNSEPYRLSSNEAEKRFLADLDGIRRERKSFAELLGGEHATKPQITETMRKTKNLNVAERVKIYIENRIRGQKLWYSSNSSKNRQKAERFFIITIILQCIATIIAFLFIKYPTFIFNPTGVSTTVIAGILAWTQLKQYKTLAESYGLTTQELGTIEERSRGIKRNDEFSSFVLEAETAISREHTIWLARRVSV